MLKALALFICLSAVLCDKARFDNYSVFHVKPQTDKQIQALAELKNNSKSIIFWGLGTKVNLTMSVVVPPHKKPDFLDFLKITNIEGDHAVFNLQEKFDERLRGRGEPFGWTRYHNLAEINVWLKSLVDQHPGLVSLEVGGESYEGREIKGVKVSYGPNKPAVFIEAGIHANEWLGTSTATYILNEVLNSTIPQVRATVEEYDWYVFPVFNPDGFEYTHTTDPTWRKTRSRLGQACVGADLNRNWDFHWRGDGGSNVSCSNHFAGVAAFSEKEAATLKQYIRGLADKIKVYLSFHTYSQIILLPYGFTGERINNFDQLMEIGNKAAAKLEQRHGTKYQVGNIVDVLYPASGGSVDWVKGTMDPPVTFTFELRDRGEDAWYVPAEQIIPTGEETFDAVMSILQDARELPFPGPRDLPGSETLPRP